MAEKNIVYYIGFNEGFDSFLVGIYVNDDGNCTEASWSPMSMEGKTEIAHGTFQPQNPIRLYNDKIYAVNSASNSIAVHSTRRYWIRR